MLAGEGQDYTPRDEGGLNHEDGTAVRIFSLRWQSADRSEKRLVQQVQGESCVPEAIHRGRRGVIAIVSHHQARDSFKRFDLADPRVALCTALDNHPTCDPGKASSEALEALGESVDDGCPGSGIGDGIDAGDVGIAFESGDLTEDVQLQVRLAGISGGCAAHVDELEIQDTIGKQINIGGEYWRD